MPGKHEPPAAFMCVASTWATSLELGDSSDAPMARRHLNTTLTIDAVRVLRGVVGRRAVLRRMPTREQRIDLSARDEDPPAEGADAEVRDRPVADQSTH